MAVATLRINPATNDFDIESGSTVTTRSITQLAEQRLLDRLQVWRGEWFINQGYGTPYRQSILKKGVTKGLIDAAIISEINKERYVDSISSFTSQIDKANRNYSCSFKVKVVNESFVNNLTTPANKEFIYPDGFSPDFRRVCAEEEILLYNDLYAYVNFEIPLII
jgi:hypothetical protein